MYIQKSEKLGQDFRDDLRSELGQAGTSDKRRDLIFFGYSGASGDGLKERDRSFLMVALTLKEHILRRFPQDEIEITCSWHKNSFIKALKIPSSTEPKLKIRQIHYVGHGAGGGLYFGYHNRIAMEDRRKLQAILSSTLWSRLPNRVKRMIALRSDAGLMSGFFTDALEASSLSLIKAQLGAGALMHIWGCFAGAPNHTFDTSDAYWNLFNAPGSPVQGIARHIAKSLAINVTAVWDPKGIHGMNFYYRDSKGNWATDKRPDQAPQWLWPTAKSVRWITYDATGVGDENQINFLGKTVTSSTLMPGRPPRWFTREVPLSRAKSRPSASPVCSPMPVTI